MCCHGPTQGWIKVGVQGLGLLRDTYQGEARLYNSGGPGDSLGGIMAVALQAKDYNPSVIQDPQQVARLTFLL